MSKQKIALIVLLAAVTAGGVFAWQYSGGPEEEVTDKTADWKIYKNEKYGFEIKLPEDWTIIRPQGDQEEFYGFIVAFETADTEMLLEQNKLHQSYRYNLSIYTRPIVSGDSADNFIVENHARSGDISTQPFFDGISTIKTGDTTIDRKEAYEYVEVGNGAAYAILVNNDGKFYSLVFDRTSSKDYLPEIEKAVLSTFKFLNQ